MERPSGKRRFPSSRSRKAARLRPAPAVRVMPVAPSTFIRRVQLLLLLGMALLLFLSQGCAAVGVALLGTAATTATKTGVSYTLDSRAHKTFTAPIDQVKKSLLAALDEMAFPVQIDEKTDDGQRIVARVEGREVEVELEAITPKTTKVRVVVREGWFWKDRATAEELIEQTSRDVDAVVLAAKYGGRVIPTFFPKAPPGDPRPGATSAAAPLEPWDPQRWRDGFQKAPAPPAAAAASPAPAPAPAVAKNGDLPGAAQGSAPVAVAFPMIAVGGGPAAGPPAAAPRVPPAADQPGADAPATLQARLQAPTPRPGEKRGGVIDRWRVLRSLPLRPCPDTACVGGARLKKDEVVVRLRAQGSWWRVWVSGTDVVGWIPSHELVLLHVTHFPKGPTAPPSP